MKFAVLEYASKSGKIWKHTPEHPNFLAHPSKEIDPTSFGCYVSALAGEHIPLTHLIKPTFVKKVIKRLLGSWPSWYTLDYLEQFDVLMVVHQLSDTHEMIAAIKRLRRGARRPFLIGVPTQPYGLLRAQVEESESTRAELVAFMDECDVFLSVVKDTVDWYAGMTSTPVVYMPQPYPAVFASQYAQAPEEKEKSILVAGVTQRDNITQGHIIARQLQKLFPDYIIRIPKVLDLDYNTSRLEGARYEILPFEEWREHLQTLAQTKLVINTDYTKTRGRVQTDCAAVGTPSLGGNSDGQVDLFPELASTPDMPLEELLRRGERLLRDEQYYAVITRQAAERLKKYDYGESADRIRLLVKTYQQ